jgi:hypothetical protein
VKFVVDLLVGRLVSFLSGKEAHSSLVDSEKLLARRRQLGGVFRFVDHTPRHALYSGVCTANNAFFQI